jgi:hypothetical protein
MLSRPRRPNNSLVVIALKDVSQSDLMGQLFNAEEGFHK